MQTLKTLFYLIILSLNQNAFEIQNSILQSGEPLYLDVVQKSLNWSDFTNTMFVVGATRIEEKANIRKKAQHHFFLVPGVGAQGGDLQKVCQVGFNEN